MKLAIIGRGTAGAITAAHFWYYLPNYEISWYFDSSIPTQAVGEGTTLVLPNNLSNFFGFSYDDLLSIDGNYKTCIRKRNWGKVNHDFKHHFYPPSMAIHFDSYKLQDWILNKLSRFPDRLKIFDLKINSYDEIDSDYIIDCSGKPSNYDNFNIAPHIPVNSVYVTQCFWESPTFDYSETIARKHGWVFGIPLQKRCSIGYLYNNNITTLDQIKADVKEVFKQCNLTPSNVTNAFSFKNYYRKENFTSRVSYNGNASFFLEPLEATSFNTVDHVNRLLFEYLISKKLSLDEINYFYNKGLFEMELMIGFHYTRGSKFNSKFWNFAQEKTKNVVSILKSKEEFKNTIKDIELNYYHPGPTSSFGFWSPQSWNENLVGLGYNKNDFY